VPDPQAASVPALPEGFDPYTAPRLELLRDGYGEYFVAASRFARGDDGVEVRVEERFYMEAGKARFVVSHSNLERWVQARGVRRSHLSLLRAGVTMFDSDVASMVGTHAIPKTIVETPMLDSNLMDSRSLDGGRSTRVCAHFELEFSKEGSYALSLNTCDHASRR